MIIPSDYKDLLSILNKHKVKYLIVGAYAVTYYTEPRYTKDIDIWVDSGIENAGRVYVALCEFGAPLQGIKIEDFTNKNLVYQMGVAPVRVDIIMGMAGLDFDVAWKNKKSAQFESVKINIIGFNELLKLKQAAKRDIDNQDMRSLLRKKRQRGKKMKKAYTLVELIVVIAIMTILAALVLPSIRRVREQQKIAQARSTIAIIQSALGKYVVEWGDYPVSGSSFITEALLSTERRGPFITLKPRDILGTRPNRRMKDPWYDGRPNPNSVYQYVYANGSGFLHGVTATIKQVYIYSCGPDQTTVSPFGGGDDITSWR